MSSKLKKKPFLSTTEQLILIFLIFIVIVMGYSRYYGVHTQSIESKSDGFDAEKYQLLMA